jgi:uncharacterized protein YgfB (UPF0149 family)
VGGSRKERKREKVSGESEEMIHDTLADIAEMGRGIDEEEKKRNREREREREKREIQ